MPKQIDFLNALPCAAKRKFKKLVYNRAILMQEEYGDLCARRRYIWTIHSYFRKQNVENMYIFLVMNDCMSTKESSNYFLKFITIKPKENVKI
jgi:hypothetical protein